MTVSGVNTGGMQTGEMKAGGITAGARRQLGNTALTLDTLGFGCAPLGNLYHALSERDASALLHAAWEAGFRHYDTAPHYGQGLSERRLGDLLRSHRAEAYVLSTKVGRLLRPAGYAAERHGFRSPMPFDIEYDYSYSGIMRSFEDSLQRLGLDRIDILYMHDIGEHTHGPANRQHFPIAMEEGYRAMDTLRAAGAVSAIGLGVNEYQVCEQALQYGDWDCFLLAGRYTLLEQEALRSFLPACAARNCSVIIGGVYNSGILASGVQGAGPFLYDYAPASPSVVDRVRRLEALCADFGIRLPAAALQFPLAHPAVASVIPGIGERSRIQDTLDVFNTEIPAAFWDALRQHKLLAETVPTPKGA